LARSRNGLGAGVADPQVALEAGRDDHVNPLVDRGRYDGSTVPLAEDGQIGASADERHPQWRLGDDHARRPAAVTDQQRVRRLRDCARTHGPHGPICPERWPARLDLMAVSSKDAGGGTAPDAIRWVFLDRDGTLNVKPAAGEYITRPQALKLLPGAAEAVGLLNQAGIWTCVVT